MIYLQEIKFNQNIVLDSNREDQSQRFKVKTKTKVVENRRKPIYDEGRFHKVVGYEKRTVTERTFTLFKKNFSVAFHDDITVIVGDNGTGKTSLVKELKPPSKQNCFSFSKSIEEQLKENWENWLSNTERTLTFSGSPSYVIVGNELHKSAMLKNAVDSQTPNKMSAAGLLSIFNINQASNGENTIDFLEGLSGIEDSLIVLDEPETSLSIKSQIKVRNLIKELSIKNQIIVITHSEHIMKLCNQVYDFESKKYADTETYIKKQINSK